MNNFDALSLYPSTMARMPGFLKGIHRQFPLMSYKNENGARTFTNDMVGRIMTVDKTQLEDLIKFHNIEFQILKGYYFDEGFNTNIKESIQTYLTNDLK